MADFGPFPFIIIFIFGSYPTEFHSLEPFAQDAKAC